MKSECDVNHRNPVRFITTVGYIRSSRLMFFEITVQIFIFFLFFFFFLF